MLAQAGLDQLVGPLITPYHILWHFAAAVLLLLILFGGIVALVRAWNRWRDP